MSQCRRVLYKIILSVNLIVKSIFKIIQWFLNIFCAWYYISHSFIALNGAMYARPQSYRSIQSVVSYLYRQFTHSQLNLKIFKYKSNVKFLHKNSVRCKHDDNVNKKDNVLNMINSKYLEYIYKLWLKNRKSVNSSWDSYFKSIHAKSSKDFGTGSSSIHVNSPLKLMASKLEGGHSSSELISTIFQIS